MMSKYKKEIIEGPTPYSILKEGGIERPYNKSDIMNLLKNEHGCLVFNLNESMVYDVDFQKWFIAGIRWCENHPYPFQWHSCVRTYCSKCHPEIIEVTAVPMNYRKSNFEESKRG